MENGPGEVAEHRLETYVSIPAMSAEEAAEIDLDVSVPYKLLAYAKRLEINAVNININLNRVIESQSARLSECKKERDELKSHLDHVSETAMERWHTIVLHNDQMLQMEEERDAARVELRRYTDGHTLMFCAREGCKRGVRPMYAVHGMCVECADMTIDELRKKLEEAELPDNGWEECELENSELRGRCTKLEDALQDMIRLATRVGCISNPEGIRAKTLLDAKGDGDG